MQIFICTNNFIFLQNNTKQKTFGFENTRLMFHQLIFCKWVNSKNPDIRKKFKMKSWKLQVRNQDFFGKGQISWNRRTLINTPYARPQKEELRKEKCSCLFSKRYPQNRISNTNLTHICTRTVQFFSKLG